MNKLIKMFLFSVFSTVFIMPAHGQKTGVDNPTVMYWRQQGSSSCLKNNGGILVNEPIASISSVESSKNVYTQIAIVVAVSSLVIYGSFRGYKALRVWQAKRQADKKALEDKKQPAA